MATQLFILFVAVQSFSTQCRGYRVLPPDNSCACPARLSASKGPGVTVTSTSKPPRGVLVASETIIEGNLDVAGKLPFLGSVGLEDVVPSYGKGVVNYNTGKVNIAITREETKKSCHGAFTPCVPRASKTIVPDVTLGITLTASSGDLVVTSGSSMSPNGIYVISENTYEGPLSVAGTLPFLSVVSFNDVLPTCGSGTVVYRCGNEPITINEISTPLNYNSRPECSDLTLGKIGMPKMY